MYTMVTKRMSTLARYKLGKVIVKTANSVIQEALDYTNMNQDLVVKRLDMSQCNKSKLALYRREVLIMNSVDHPNLLNYIDGFIHREELYLVMPQYAASLADVCSGHGIKDKVLIANIFGRILQGLSYLHSQRIVHRDIKGGNVLLDPNVEPERQLVITDFGVSKECLDQDPTSFVGTPCWMSPELCESGGVDSYDSKTDIWSIGITFLEVYFGRAPYMEYPPMKVIMLIHKQPPPIPFRHELGGHM